MILPAQTIRELCINEPIGMIEPFHERNETLGMTYGLSPAGYDIRLGEQIAIPYEGHIHLASSIERFHMPNDILGVVHDKSSWARKGLLVQNTVIEPGWYGYLTLELTLHKVTSTLIDPLPLQIPALSPIAQIVFHRLEEGTHEPYSGKYQGQAQGPQEAK